MANRVQHVTDQCVATHAEIGSSNIDLLNGLALEQIIQHIGEAGLYIVNDIRDTYITRCYSKGSGIAKPTLQFFAPSLAFN